MVVARGAVAAMVVVSMVRDGGATAAVWRVEMVAAVVAGASPAR